MTPSADIHLFLNGPPGAFGADPRGKRVSLTFSAQRVDVSNPIPSFDPPTDITADVTVDCLGRAPSAATAVVPPCIEVDLAAREIRAVRVGMQMLRFQWTNPAPRTPADATVSVYVRVCVHEQLVGWWFGCDSVTVPKDAQAAHTQPDIFALFSDDAVGDITGHGFVTLVLDPPGKATVTGSGRLIGQEAGEALLWGELFGRKAGLPVRVFDYAGVLREVTPVAQHGQNSEQRNLLFLSEGFGPGEEDLFDGMVARITDRMFCQRRHSPYNRLRKRFNVWKRFEASAEPGTSVGRPRKDDGTAWGGAAELPDLHQRVDCIFFTSEDSASAGLPRNDADINPNPANQAGFNPLALTDTQSNDVEDFHRWLASNWESIARREQRGDRAQTFEAEALQLHLRRYVNMLKAPGEEMDTRLGLTWFPNPRSMRVEDTDSLVVLLARGWAKTAWWKGLGYIDLHLQGPKPAEVYASVTMVHAPSQQRTRRRSKVVAEPPAWDVHLTAQVLSHELGHALHLGDEYGADSRTPPQVPTTPRWDNIETAQRLAHASAAAPAIDPAKLAWASLVRVRKSDSIRNTVAPGPTQVTLKLADGRAAEWARHVGEAAYVRPLIMDAARRIAAPRAPVAGTLDGTSRATNEVTLRLASPLDVQLAAGSLLYLPQQVNGVPVPVIHADVMEWMRFNKKPLHPADRVNPGYKDNVEVRSPPPELHAKVKSTHPSRIIGAYEGGNEQMFDRYRPCGACRMRQSVSQDAVAQFCFVCKYYLALRIDPGILADLDNCEFGT